MHVGSGLKRKLPAWANVDLTWGLNCNWEDLRAFVCPHKLEKHGITLSTLFKNAPFVAHAKEKLPLQHPLPSGEGGDGGEDADGAAGASSSPAAKRAGTSTLRNPLLKRLKTSVQLKS